MNPAFLPGYLDPWPLRDLVVTTPRLVLRPATDADVYALAALATGPVEPDGQPLGAHEHHLSGLVLARSLTTQFWRHRAELTPEAWQIDFTVLRDQRLIGLQSITAKHFQVTREVSTSSWLTLPEQGQGFGTEMRAAALGLAFDHLGAEQARSRATASSAASNRISTRLGYLPDGSDRLVRRGTYLVQLTRYLLTRDRFARCAPTWRPEVTGLGPCLDMLGLPFLGV